MLTTPSLTNRWCTRECEADSVRALFTYNPSEAAPDGGRPGRPSDLFHGCFCRRQKTQCIVNFYEATRRELNTPRNQEERGGRNKGHEIIKDKMICKTNKQTSREIRVSQAPHHRYQYLAAAAMKRRDGESPPKLWSQNEEGNASSSAQAGHREKGAFNRPRGQV